jgi:sensor domain CHASE-containing protein
MSSMSQKLIELQNKLSGKDAQKGIDVYEAITKRIDVLAKIGITPKDHAVFLQDLMRQEHAAGLDYVTSALQSQMTPEAEGV